MRFLGLSATALFTLTTCAAPQALPPQSSTKPTRPPVNNTVLLPPVAAPREVAQPMGHWTDWPMEAGAWSYARDDRGSIARYGVAGRDAIVMLRCDRQRGRIYFSRAASAGGNMMVRTSSVSKSIPVGASSGQPPYVASDLPVNDAVLDAMAFSRGRIAVELPGAQNIAVPVWSEIGRVVEDCRA